MSEPDIPFETPGTIALVGNRQSVLRYARERNLDPVKVERGKPQANGYTYVLVAAAHQAHGWRFTDVLFLHGGNTAAWQAAMQARR